MSFCGLDYQNTNAHLSLTSQKTPTLFLLKRNSTIKYRIHSKNLQKYYYQNLVTWFEHATTILEKISEKNLCFERMTAGSAYVYFTVDYVRSYSNKGKGVLADSFLPPDGNQIKITPEFFNNEDCNPVNVVIHELLHVLGFRHTNALEEDIENRSKSLNIGLDNDNGIMHPFKNNGLDEIDIKNINLLYGKNDYDDYLQKICYEKQILFKRFNIVEKGYMSITLSKEEVQKQKRIMEENENLINSVMENILQKNKIQNNNNNNVFINDENVNVFQGEENFELNESFIEMKFDQEKGENNSDDDLNN